MKRQLVIWLVAGMLPVTISCAASHTPVVFGPVGPEPAHHDESVSMGYLKVWSATESHYDGDVGYFPHSEYYVYSMDGKLVKKVPNAISIHDEDPALVQIPAGIYTILAEAQYYGMIRVKVVVDPGTLTSVHLEYNKPSNRDHAENNDDLVRLPNGSVVGWRVDGSRANAAGPMSSNK